MKPPEQDGRPQGESIKIEDRRLFTPDGQLREEAKSRSRVARPKDGPGPDAGAKGETRPGTDPAMLGLIEYLTETAALHLGAGPEGGLGPVDLRAARQVTQMLEALRQRTAGRLSQDEQRLLEERLYQLQMIFMERSRPPGR